MPALLAGRSCGRIDAVAGMDDIPGLRIWIDATQPGSEIGVFGMMLLERLLRAVAEVGASLNEVCVALPSRSSPPEGLPAQLLDEKVRTFISRRNVNMALFTVALLLDWALPGLRAAEFTFYFIVLWQVAGLAWHAERVVQFWNARPAR